MEEPEICMRKEKGNNKIITLEIGIEGFLGDNGQIVIIPNTGLEALNKKGNFLFADEMFLVITEEFARKNNLKATEKW